MFPNNENIFPAKPELVQPQSGYKLWRLLLSILLFFVVFVTLFSDSYFLVSEIVLVLLIHEFGHLLVMKMYGYKSLNMIFIPFLGAMVTGNKMQVSQKQKIMISLMGPLPGIILGCSLFIICLSGNANVYLVEFALLLICINVLNLVPLDPLDGGNIMETLFFPSSDKAKMFFALFSSLMMIGIGVYFQFWPIMVFGFLMAFKVRAFQKNKVIHDDLDEMEFDYRKEYKDLTDGEYWTLRRVFLDNNPRIKDVIPEDDPVWENEKLIVEQVNQLLRMEIKRDLNALKKTLFFVLTIAAIVLPFVLIFKNYSLIEWYLLNVGI
jgi:stage IV sporulation protein FB